MKTILTLLYGEELYNAQAMCCEYIQGEGETGGKLGLALQGGKLWAGS